MLEYPMTTNTRNIFMTPPAPRKVYWTYQGERYAIVSAKLRRYKWAAIAVRRTTRAAMSERMRITARIEATRLYGERTGKDLTRTLATLEAELAAHDSDPLTIKPMTLGLYTSEEDACHCVYRAGYHGSYEVEIVCLDGLPTV